MPYTPDRRQTPKASRRVPVREPSPHTHARALWIAGFGVWLFVLSGVPHDIGRRLGLSFLRAPGFLQYTRLQQQVDRAQKDLQEARETVLSTQAFVRSLENDPKAQEREARRVLGWVSPEELVFEF